MAAPSSALRPQPIWFVQAAGRVWGPYAQARLRSFVEEGRLTAQSLIATQANGPFGPAGRRKDLAFLFPPPAAAPKSLDRTPLDRTPLERTPGPPAYRPAPDFRAHDPARLTEYGRSEPGRPVVVWAELASLTYLRFEAVLAVHGRVVGIRPGLWLVRTPLGPAGLRNAVSRRLRSDDALLVVDAPLDRAAWFNLDGVAERELRQVWEDGPRI